MLHTQTEIEENEILTQLMVDSRVANQNRPQTSEGGRRKRGPNHKVNNVSTQALNSLEPRILDLGLGKSDAFLSEKKNFDQEMDCFLNDCSVKMNTNHEGEPPADNINFELIQKLQVGEIFFKKKFEI